MTLEEYEARQREEHEALDAMTEGPFAALFFSIEMLTSGDHERATRFALLGGAIDALAAVGGEPRARGMEMSEPARRGPSGRLPVEPAVIGTAIVGAQRRPTCRAGRPSVRRLIGPRR
jgi:hypothetical protein